MSAHMKKPHTEYAKIAYNGRLYKIPKTILKKYKSTDDDFSVSSDELFEQIDDEHTKPGALLKGLRHRENLSQVDFAKKIGVSQNDLSKMENGKRTIGKAVAKRIADAFETDYRYFL